MADKSFKKSELKNKELPELYEDISELTFEHCKQTCHRLGSCCSLEYCEVAIEYAKTEYGVTLERTANEKLPLLDEKGACTAAPHFRQMCAFHSCDISGPGFFKNDETRTRQYFMIRKAIEIKEFTRFCKENGLKDEV